MHSLAGIAQVIVQPCPLSGFIILLGIFIHSWQMALGAFFGSIIGTISAKILNFKHEDIQLGIYGYNATLIGIANIYFFWLNFNSLITFIVTCVISVFITMWIPKYLKLPAYTAPFVIITWIIFLFRENLHLIPATDIFNFENNLITYGLGESVGQVYLQGNGLTGVLMLFAVLLCSRSSFIWAVIAAFTSLFIAHILALPVSNIESGLYGFSAVLTAIVLKDTKSITIALAGILVSVIITQLFIVTRWPSLTAPFVLACWILGIVHRNLGKTS